MPTLTLNALLRCGGNKPVTIALLDDYHITLQPSGRIALSRNNRRIARSESIWPVDFRSGDSLSVEIALSVEGELFNLLVNGKTSGPCYSYGNEERREEPPMQSFADLERRVQKLEERPTPADDLFQYAVDLMRSIAPRSRPLGEEAE